MRFLADESVERPVVIRLRDAGYDVSYVSEAHPGAPDDIVLDQATRELRILLTNDKDFGTLAFLQRRASAGVVLLRLPRWRSDRKGVRLLRRHPDARLPAAQGIYRRRRGCSAAASIFGPPPSVGADVPCLIQITAWSFNLPTCSQL